MNDLKIPGPMTVLQWATVGVVICMYILIVIATILALIAVF